jgi:hypothetical protein
MEVNIPSMNLDQYMALETFIASAENRFYIQGIGKSSAESEATGTKDGPATLYKLKVKSIGDTVFDLRAKAQKYRDITVQIDHANSLTRDELNSLMGRLHFPDKKAGTGRITPEN